MSTLTESSHNSAVIPEYTLTVLDSVTSSVYSEVISDVASDLSEQDDPTTYVLNTGATEPAFESPEMTTDFGKEHSANHGDNFHSGSNSTGTAMKNSPGDGLASSVESEAMVFRDNSYYPRDTEEEMPLVNGTSSGSSQDCENSDSGRGGRGYKQEDGGVNGEHTSFLTCSSASGGGSSTGWSEGEGTQGEPQYGQLDSGEEMEGEASELSSPGGTPVPQECSQTTEEKTTKTHSSPDGDEGREFHTDTGVSMEQTSCSDVTPAETEPPELSLPSEGQTSDVHVDESQSIGKESEGKMNDDVEEQGDVAAEVGRETEITEGGNENKAETATEGTELEETTGEHTFEQLESGSETVVTTQEHQPAAQGPQDSEEKDTVVENSATSLEGVCAEEQNPHNSADPTTPAQVEVQVQVGEGEGDEYEDLSLKDSEQRPRTSTLIEDIDNPLLESNLDSSNLDAGVRRGSRDPPAPLKPLSPDPDLNEQYEHLRRTLSHSRRRYSTRRHRRDYRDRSSSGVSESEFQQQRKTAVTREQSIGSLLRDVLQTRGVCGHYCNSTCMYMYVRSSAFCLYSVHVELAPRIALIYYTLYIHCTICGYTPCAIDFSQDFLYST